MASLSIKKRTKSNGEARYLALIRVSKNGSVVYNESRTFSKNSAAKSWGRNRILEIEENGYKNQETTLTLGDLLNKYLSEKHFSLKRTKKNVLKLLLKCDISKIQLIDLASKDIIEHCKIRKQGGTGKSTINHDVSYIRSVLKAAKPIWGININDQCIIDSYHVLHEMDLIGKSNRRTRRPSTEELALLEKELEIRQNHRSSKIPYLDILNFSILSCMRIGEVCSVTWNDVDYENKAVLVRDRKDPRKQSGNHMVVPLLGDSWNILKRQPKVSERIFPYSSRSVTAGFQRVRNDLGIEDLRYHDLRREGASRLFEAGYKIDEVAQVTGHKNINTLWQVYTELYPSRLHRKS
jgi:integrase